MLLTSPAACTTGDWLQKFNCARHQPVSPAITQAGYTTGHDVMPAVIAGIIIGLIILAIRSARHQGTPATK